jgi:hypothetical protein
MIIGSIAITFSPFSSRVLPYLPLGIDSLSLTPKSLQRFDVVSGSSPITFDAVVRFKPEDVRYHYQARNSSGIPASISDFLLTNGQLLP